RLAAGVLFEHLTHDYRFVRDRFQSADHLAIGYLGNMPVPERARATVTPSALRRPPLRRLDMGRLRLPVSMRALPIQSRVHARHPPAQIHGHQLDAITSFSPLEHVFDEVRRHPAITAGQTIGRIDEQDRLPMLTGELGSSPFRFAKPWTPAAFVS